MNWKGYDLFSSTVIAPAWKDSGTLIKTSVVTIEMVGIYQIRRVNQYTETSVRSISV
jgi:hypothetical protein